MSRKMWKEIFTRLWETMEEVSRDLYDIYDE